jgi:dTDP-4-amino-4,6-dideoxygalactose transaminase
VHLQNCYRSWGYRAGSLPATERVAAEILSLPMFPGLTAEQQGRVVAAIGASIGSKYSALSVQR